MTSFRAEPRTLASGALRRSAAVRAHAVSGSGRLPGCAAASTATLEGAEDWADQWGDDGDDDGGEGEDYDDHADMEWQCAIGGQRASQPVLPEPEPIDRLEPFPMRMGVMGAVGYGMFYRLRSVPAGAQQVRRRVRARDHRALAHRPRPVLPRAQTQQRFFKRRRRA